MKHTVYEGFEPYVFVSYSHKDQYELNDVLDCLKYNGVRFWYDDGLHSGDDWNYVIATHLERAAVCLLLLSAESAISEYVKNELSFAINHRIPIHTLILHTFSIPVDIELMMGRRQALQKVSGYQSKLVSDLPIEVFCIDQGTLTQVSSKYEHPLFSQERMYLDRQGTKTFTGRHRILGYSCSIQTDILRHELEPEAHLLASLCGDISHPLFPRIYDIVIKNGVCRTYQEYGNEVFLDDYLREHSLSETKIKEWILLILDGFEYLYKRNLGLRDLARGSLIVRDDGKIGLFRLQNNYYGLIRLTAETKQYYFETELQEIAILLAQMCTRSVPLLPLRRIIKTDYHTSFINRVNLVIQKCTREYGRTQYSSFSEVKKDIQKRILSISDIRFLRSRYRKLQQYDEERAKRQALFIATDRTDFKYQRNEPMSNIEVEFGFDSTALLSADEQNDFRDEPVIRILACATGNIYEFSRNSVTIGKSEEHCDLIWKQPFVSRIHARIEKKSSNTYVISDLNTTNGSYVSFKGKNVECKHERIMPSMPVEVPDYTYIVIGEAWFQLLPVDA